MGANEQNSPKVSNFVLVMGHYPQIVFEMHHN